MVRRQEKSPNLRARALRQQPKEKFRPVVTTVYGCPWKPSCGFDRGDSCRPAIVLVSARPRSNIRAVWHLDEFVVPNVRAVPRVHLFSRRLHSTPDGYPRTRHLFKARPFQGQLGVSNTSAEMRGNFSPRPHSPNAQSEPGHGGWRDQRL
jgi:hypothetical protein